MAKAKKEKEQPYDWEKRVKSLEAENSQLTRQNIELIRANRYSKYLTVDQFVKEYTGALKEYLGSQYRHGSTDLLHPEDLAASAANFSDAWWVISQHTDYNARGTNIGKP